jgi:integrase
LTGTVIKRGTKWASVVTVGTKVNRDGNVVPDQKWKTFKTKKEAEAYTAEIVSQVSKGEFIPDSKITVGEWLKKWFDIYINQNQRRKIRTKETYKAVLNKHLVPKLGHIQLQKLTPTDIQNYYNSSTLSEGTLGQHQAILSQALKVAMNQENLIKKNPAELVAEKPNGKKVTREMETWNQEEIKKFLLVARQKGINCETFYTLALETAMRKGEICGLKWSDINFDTSTLAVKRTLLKSGINPVLGPPKNGKSRNIALSQPILELLRKWKVRQAEIRLQLGTEYDDQGFVFTKKNGKPLQINNLGQNEFARLIKKANVKKIRFHDLRHTAITLMIENGINIKAVSERAGHSDVGITLNRYSHVTPTMQKQAAQVMGDLLSCH